MFCPDCGAENSRSQKFCTRCGTNLIAIDRAREIVSEMKANVSAPPVSPRAILIIVALTDEKAHFSVECFDHFPQMPGNHLR